MSIDRGRLKAIIAKDIKSQPRGSFIPDQFIKSFMDNCVNYCLFENVLTTDYLTKWLEGEHNFSEDEILSLLEGIRKKAQENLGVEVLYPGEQPPQGLTSGEASESSAGQTDDRLSLADAGDMEGDIKYYAKQTGKYAADFPILKKDLEETKPKASKKSAGSSGVPEKAASLTPKQAMNVLAALALGKASAIPEIDSLAEKTVVTCNFLRDLFLPTAADSKVYRAIRGALCWQLILECNFMQYDGMGKVGGKVPQDALGRSRTLIDSVKGYLETLDGIIKQIHGSNKEEFDRINDARNKLKGTLKKLDGFITSIS